MVRSWLCVSGTRQTFEGMTPSLMCVLPVLAETFVGITPALYVVMNVCYERCSPEDGRLVAGGMEHSILLG